MEMKTEHNSKPEIALVCNLIPHSIISSQASELHLKRGRTKFNPIYQQYDGIIVHGTAMMNQNTRGKKAGRVAGSSLYSKIQCLEIEGA